MKRFAVLSSFAALAFASALALPAAASSAGDDALSLVPADAASVGVIHVADLRTSPLAARLFSDTDHISVAGDAQHFLDEAGFMSVSRVESLGEFDDTSEIMSLGRRISLNVIAIK